jgi:hypothetical protein
MRPEDLTPPPDPRTTELRFDPEFHPLFHRFGDSTCRSLQPLPRALYLHLLRQWQYGRVADLVRTRIRRCTTCLVGRHRYGNLWRRNGDSWTFVNRKCGWCDKDDPDLVTHERIG